MFSGIRSNSVAYPARPRPFKDLAQTRPPLGAGRTPSAPHKPPAGRRHPSQLQTPKSTRSSDASSDKSERVVSHVGRKSTALRAAGIAWEQPVAGARSYPGSKRPFGHRSTASNCTLSKTRRAITRENASHAHACTCPVHNMSHKYFAVAVGGTSVGVGSGRIVQSYTTRQNEISSNR